MAEQWYWKHRGETLGPIDTEDLEDLVKHHRVLDRDELKVAGTNEWISGADVKSLFAGRKESSTSAAASRLLEDAERLQRKRLVEGSSSSGSGGYWLKRIMGLFGSLGDRVGDVLIPLLHPLVGLLNRKVLLGVLAVVWLGILLRGVDLFGGSQNRKVFAELTAVWDQMQEMKARDASDKEWKQFQKETSAWVNSTIEMLKKESERHPMRWSGPMYVTDLIFPNYRNAATRRELLHTLHVVKMMMDNDPKSGERDTYFLAHMESTEGLLSGKYKEGIQANRAAQGAESGSGSLDPAMAGILILDGVLIVGGLAYWFRRRRA